MNIIFISNFLSPHQIPICDEWDSMDDVSIKFIEVLNIDKSTLPIGWRATSNRHYVVSYQEYQQNYDAIQQEIIEADAVIVGGVPITYARARVAKGLITFYYSERIYKNSRQLLKMPLHLFKFPHWYPKNSNIHLLCASAFAAYDYRRLGCFVDKAYRWGYFTPVDDRFEIEDTNLINTSSNNVPIMWCARFLKLKHPELPIQMAKRLKDKGYCITLNMYGSGVEYERMKKLIHQLKVDDVVFLKGELPNVEILKMMRKHEIFLFTSDQNEGWGAVANEAMANGCVLVGGSTIGSVPYLLEDGINGLIFKSKSLDSLTDRVEWLLQHPKERLSIRKEAVKTMKQLWSPKIAAGNFVRLLDCLLKGSDTNIENGPGSKDITLLKNNWF